MRAPCGAIRRRAVGMAMLLAGFGGWAPAMAQTSRPSDDDDLGKRLVREATGETAPGIMGEITEMMSAVAERLTRDEDPGVPTQAVQRQIIKRLDDAIASARRRRSGQPQGGQQSSDRRQSPSPSEEGAAQEGTVGQDSLDPRAAGKGHAEENTGPGRFPEVGRGWGALPARDREEVVQGIGEEVVEKYRGLVDRYFKTLAKEDGG